MLKAQKDRAYYKYYVFGHYPSSPENINLKNKQEGAVR
jgi:hypothetical protein